MCKTEVKAKLDLRNPIFTFLNQELFDLRKIYEVNLKTGCSEKMSYVGELGLRPDQRGFGFNPPLRNMIFSTPDTISSYNLDLLLESE